MARGPLYRLKQGTTLERLPDCILLFSAQDQQIHALNETSGALARALLGGATEEQLVGELLASGVQSPAASDWVRGFLTDIADRGLLYVDQTATVDAASEQQLSVAGQRLALKYASPDLRQILAPAYVHLEADDDDCERFEISDLGAFVTIARDDLAALVTPRASTAVRLKGLVLDLVLQAPRHVAALHAALLERDGQALLLFGSPGAGKSVLTLELMTHGFRYGTDDVTLLQQDGTAKGVPLAPAIKESAWPLVSPRWAGFTILPVHLRPDGQQVRFISLSRENLAPPSPVRTILRLFREDGPACLKSVTSQGALAELFRESRSPDGRCSTQILRAIASIVTGAACFDLHYSDAAEAASIISDRLKS